MSGVGRNLSVAVIGAGAAGLCAARHLVQHPRLKATVFELGEVVGGTWVYSDTVGPGIHSSMYRNLRTNLPKEVMSYPDFSFPPSLPSFVHHSDVRAYLQEYSTRHQLGEVIRFQTRVTGVRPLPSHDPGQDLRWEVTSECLKTKEVTSSMFDSVMVCSGHYSVPVTPSLPGIEQFEGKLLHSHDYRQPEDFTGQVVLMLGAGASGTDISVELAAKVERVFLAHRGDRIAAKMPPNVVQVQGVRGFVGGRRIVLEDDSEVEVDTVILATGYHYTFPFLHPDCQVRVKERRVGPLYKHLINIEQPTMCLVGIPVMVCPFPQFDLQVRFFIKVLLGDLQLPSKEEMYQDTKVESDWRQNELGQPSKYFHKMGNLQWNYNNGLAREAGLEPLKNRVESLYEEVHQMRRADLVGYKKVNYAPDG